MVDYSQVLFWLAIVVGITLIGYTIYYLIKKKNIKPLVRLIFLMVEIFADGVVTPEEWDILTKALREALVLHNDKEEEVVVEPPESVV